MDDPEAPPSKEGKIPPDFFLEFFCLRFSMFWTTFFLNFFWKDWFFHKFWRVPKHHFRPFHWDIPIANHWTKSSGALEYGWFLCEKLFFAVLTPKCYENVILWHCKGFSTPFPKVGSQWITGGSRVDHGFGSQGTPWGLPPRIPNTSKKISLPINGYARSF